MKYLIIGIVLLARSMYGQTAWWDWQNPKPQGSNLRDVAMLDSSTYIAVGDGGLVIKTTDDGANWKIQTLGTSPLTGVAMSPNKLHGVIIGDQGATYNTTDGGETWAKIVHELPTRFKDAIYTADLNATAIGMAGARYTTTNGGISWRSTTFDSLDNLLSVHFTSEQRGFISASYGIFYVTNDGGTNWTRKEFPFGNSIMSIHASDAKHMIAAGEAGGVFLSNDSGNTWTRQEIQTTSVIRSVVRLSSQQAIMCADKFTLYGTTNGGLTWEDKLNDSLVRNEHLKSLSFSDPREGVCVGWNGIIMRTHDGGLTWQPVFEKAGAGEALRGVYCFSEKLSVAVGSAILRTTNSGKNWTAVEKPTTRILRAVDFPDNTIGYAVGDSGAVLKSFDQGKSWAMLPSPLSANLVAVSFLTTEHGVAVGSEQEVMVTSDGGTTWRVTRVAPDYEFTACAYLAPDSILVVGNDRTDPTFTYDYAIFFQSTNAGTDWTEIPGSRITNMLTSSVSFADPFNGYVVGSRGGNAGSGAGYPMVAATADGGRTWKLGLIDVEFNGPLNAVSAADRLRATAVGAKGLSVRTTDGGTSWKRVETNTRATIVGIHHPTVKTATAVGYSAMILRLTTTDQPLAVEHPVAATADDVVTSIFPNPAKTQTTIQLSLPSHDVLSVDLLSVEGHRVRTLYRGITAPGEHTLSADLSGLPSGVYLLEVRGTNDVEYHRLVIRK